MADGGVNGAPIETSRTTVVESPRRAVIPEKPRKRKKKSSDGWSNSAASDGDGKEKQEANKKERIVWTPKLHGKFVKVCNELGIEDAVPMKILQRMKTTRITRAQVASHLQKYRDNLSKRKDVASIGESSVTALHHTPPVHLPAVPPSPQSPLDMRSQTQLGHVVQPLQQPSNGHSSSSHAVEESLLYDQQLHLLLVQPPLQPQCFAAPLHQIDPVARRELIMEEQLASSMMQQNAAAASQHSPMPVVGVEQQAAGAPVPASGEQNHHLEPHLQPPQAVNMLRGECSVPEDNMILYQESETRTAQLQVGAEAEKGQGRAAKPTVASSLSPPVSIIEQYWRSDCEPSWDLFGSLPLAWMQPRRQSPQ